MAKVKIGIIGGTGLDNPDIMEKRKEMIVSTPYGSAGEFSKLVTSSANLIGDGTRSELTLTYLCRGGAGSHQRS